MKISKISAFTIVALATAASAHASTIFSDNFDNDPYALNTTPAGWTVTNGTVDVVGPAYFGLCQAGQGRCVDLDGSSNQSGVLATAMNMTAGVTYTATFQLGGNQRYNQIDNVTVGFGNTSRVFAIGENAAFTTYSATFTPSTSGTYKLSFLDSSNNNVGAILDNVKVSAVPEPQTYALMGAGLLLLAAATKRRQQQ